MRAGGPRLTRLRAWLDEALGRRPPPGLMEGNEKRAWKREVAQALGALETDELEAIVDLWRSRFEDVESARASINARANGLLPFVGVITAGAALVSTVLVDAHPLPVVLAAGAGLVLLFASALTVYFAAGVQRVAFWDAPWLDLADPNWQATPRISRAVEIYVAAHQNRLRLQVPVVLLSRAQWWARVALFALVVFVVFAVGAALSKP
jgi:hypothetical protein